MLRQHPYGVPFDSTDTTAYCTAGTACQAGQPAGTISRTASNPTPGVWEVTLDTSRTSTTDPGTFTITASILGVVISPASWTVDPAHIGTAYSQLFSFTNNYGAFTGNAAGTALGSAVRRRPTIANGAQQQFTVTVPAGSTSLSARIGNTSDTRPTSTCSSSAAQRLARGSDGGRRLRGAVTINNPLAPATGPSWSTASPSRPERPRMTTSTCSRTPVRLGVDHRSAALHPSGSTWSATASTTPLAAPAAGRFLQGFVRVSSTTGSLLGSAEVQLKNVGP